MSFLARRTNVRRSPGFRRAAINTHLGVVVAALLAAQTPSFDQLDAAAIPKEERIAGQPKELVAVLGSNRGRHWHHIICMARSPDGNYLACGQWGGVRVW